MEVSSDEFVIYPTLCQRSQVWTSSGPITQIKLPSEARIESVIIFEETSDGNVLLPYNIVKCKPSNKDRKVVATKGDLIIKGSLLEQSEDAVLIQTSPGPLVRLRNYDCIETYDSPDDLHGYLVSLSPNAGHAPTNKVHITYLMSDISWKGNYTVILDVENETFSMFRFTGILSNNTRDVLASTKTTLIAGWITTGSDSISLGEYTELPVGNLSLTPTTSVDVFTLTNIEASKIFTNTFLSEEVLYGYRFTAPRFLPSGSVYIYASGQSLVGSLIGATSLSDSREKESVLLMLGGTSSVRISSASSEIPNGITLTSEIVNSNEAAITLILKYALNLYPLKEVICLSPPNTTYTRKGNIIEFVIHIEGSDTVEFACTLKLGLDR